MNILSTKIRCVYPVICVFSFYIVLLPVALFFYLGTIIIYQYEKYLIPTQAVQNFLKLILVAGIGVLLSTMLFKHQVELKEISGSLNLMGEHGKNIVPLNPWSLVQEKPNPMPNRKDFGLWLNIVVGIIFSGFVLRIIYHNLLRLKNQKQTDTFYYKDLIAAASV